jgi:hypothetical protein
MNKSDADIAMKKHLAREHARAEFEVVYRKMIVSGHGADTALDAATDAHDAILRKEMPREFKP